MVRWMAGTCLGGARTDDGAAHETSGGEDWHGVGFSWNSVERCSPAHWQMMASIQKRGGGVNSYVSPLHRTRGTGPVQDG